MLVAKREPFELGADDRGIPPAPVSSRFTRTLHILQILGALVAVPAGLGSAYTVYKTNYSAEGTCQSLRANIISMIDRNVEAGIRRALVRRDVETFETTCGAGDPDATAAFKTLLALDKARPAAAPPPQQPQAAVSKVEPAAAKAEPAPVAKAEPAPAPKAKQPPARAVVSASAEPETPTSDDAAWLAAVRGALANHPKQAAPAAAPSSLTPLGEMTPALPAAPLAAPTLPPPASVASPAPQVDPDRPVPPGAIPQAPPPDATKPPSRMEAFVSEIPFFGKALADRISR